MRLVCLLLCLVDRRQKRSTGVQLAWAQVNGSSSSRGTTTTTSIHHDRPNDSRNTRLFGLSSFDGSSSWESESSSSVSHMETEVAKEELKSREKHIHKVSKDTHDGTTTGSYDSVWGDDVFAPLVLFSEDEFEERVVSALAKVEDEENEMQKNVVERLKDRRSKTTKLQRPRSHKSSINIPSTRKDTIETSERHGQLATQLSSLTMNNAARASLPSTRSDHGTGPTSPASNPDAPKRPVTKTQKVPLHSTEHQNTVGLKRDNDNKRSSMRPQPDYSSVLPARQAQPTRDKSMDTLVESRTTTTPWVQRFLSSKPRDALLPVPRAYLSDGFNLVQLAPIVEKFATQLDRQYNSDTTAALLQQKQASYPYYKAALRLILSENDSDSNVSRVVQLAAEALYLLVHARYVISPRGLDTVKRLMKKDSEVVEPVFGKCPRISCRGMPLLPFGDSDHLDFDNNPLRRCKRYCCCCGEKFYLWESKADGCAWGPSFCHLFVLTHGQNVFPGLVSISEVASPKSPSTVRPQIFGFNLHSSCKARYPQMP